LFLLKLDLGLKGISFILKNAKIKLNINIIIRNIVNSLNPI